MKKKNFITYVFLTLAILLLSITSTLAIIKDNENAKSGILKFDKVSICADKAGSVLSAIVDSEIGDESPIITEENKFIVAPTKDSTDCFIRVRFYFTTNNETINEKYETTLETLTNNGNPVGLVMYSDSNYGYTLHTDGWYYLVDVAGDTILREVYSTDTAYTITQNYSVPKSVLTTDVYTLTEEVASVKAEIHLICEVYAIQCENLQTIDKENLTGNALIVPEIRNKHGEVTILQFISAVNQNIANIETPEEPYPEAGLYNNSNELVTPWENLIANNILTITNGALKRNKSFSPGKLVIANDNSVTSISDRAFSSCSYLTEITIPNSVTSIGDNAFYNCYKLTKITIPNSITSIGTHVLSYCSSLTEITIPNSVTSIGDNAFYECSKLTKITIPNSVTSIGTYAFSYCSSLTEITISSSITSISKNAFSGCSSLKNIIIPNSVTSIGDSAFNNCSSLENIIIPNSVTSIGNSAFSVCTSLTNITIPDSVTSIGNWTFNKCSALTNVNISNSVTSIGNSMFTDCTNLTDIIIPNSVTSIGNSAFRNCSNLNTITISNSVTSINQDAFRDCFSLKTIYICSQTIASGLTYQSVYQNLIYYADTFYIKTDITTIGRYVTSYFVQEKVDETPVIHTINEINYYRWIQPAGLYNNNGALITTWEDLIANKTLSVTDGTLVCNDSHISGKLIINNDITSIGDDAFNLCSDLTEISIPNSVTSIGNGAFYGCSSITQFKIPNSVTSIGYNAFRNCSNLYKIIISDSITYLNQYIFSDCTNLTNIEIPKSVISIDNGAFYNCSSLTEITIPKSVTSIGNDAFYNCSKLKTIQIISSTIAERLTSKDTLGYLISKAETIYIESSIKKIGSYIQYNFISDENVGYYINNYSCSKWTKK